MQQSFISDKPFRIVFFSCCLIWTIINASLLRQYGLPMWQAVGDSVVSNILMAGFCILVLNNMRYYLPGQEKYWYILVLAIALSSVWLIMTRFFLWLLFSRYPEYMFFLRHSSAIRFSIAFLVISCIETMGLLWYTQQERNENENREKEIARIAREAELFKLRQQLQPHFLFNSLNSISALTGTQPEKARHMIQQLSDFLRGTLRKDEDQWNSLQEELEYLQLYLDIEKVRFGQRLQPVVVIEPGAASLKLPALLLQPVVENAIKFGLYDQVGDVEIKITATRERDDLVITISNPFDPETSGNRSGTGFGLSSISRRLYLLFARTDLLQSAVNGNNFTTTIIIPQATIK